MTPEAQRIAMKSMLILELEALLLSAQKRDCCSETITLIKEAIAHQTMAEDIAAMVEREGPGGQGKEP